MYVLDRPRSHSMDAAVHVHTKHYNNINNIMFNVSEPITVNDKLNVCSRHHLENSSKCSSSLDQCENSLSLESYLCNIKSLSNSSISTSYRNESPGSSTSRPAVKRPMDPLFLHFGQTYVPEKRLSDPHIRYSFYNKGFDITTATVSRRRFASQNDVRKNAMPNIAEYCFDEPVDWQKLKPNQSDFRTRSPTYLGTIPKIKVRISEEWGQRIDSSFDSNGSDFFDDLFPETRHEVSEDDTIIDAFDIADRTVQRCCETKKICKKCGHCPVLPPSTTAATAPTAQLQKQFSSSFN